MQTPKVPKLICYMGVCNANTFRKVSNLEIQYGNKVNGRGNDLAKVVWLFK
jgi:hypothetical protein